MRRITLTVLLLIVPFIGFSQNTPEETFESYKQSLKEGDVDTYMSFLTLASQSIVSPRKGLMYREYTDLSVFDYDIKKGYLNSAVVHFKPSSKKVPPYLLKKEAGHWKIDLKTMQNKYGFDMNENWYYK